MAKENKNKKNKLDRGESAKTNDHEVIKQWVEERGGRPSAVKSTAAAAGGPARSRRIEWQQN
jgi:hypothetical protein